ncbi:MAG: ribosomal protein [Thermoleophilia bacterium]|nr:ribosomal protein [Thermoleophilia bacterium]
MTAPLEETKGLHSLAPAKGATKARKRIGRGPASGTGKTSGRGHKGQNSRSGGGVRPGFEGGQMPIYMRVGKLRGSNKKMSMPMGPFRTHTLPVNVEALAGFDAGTEVTPELLKQAGVLKHLKHPVKILGRGELGVKLTVVAHAVSDSARAKIEAAGGTVQLIEGPKPHGRHAAKLEKQAAYEAGKSGSATSEPKAEKADAPADDA